MKALLLFALITSTPSFADENKDHCEKEREKYCKGMKLDDPNLRSCLKAKIKELSIECQRQVDRMPVKMTRKKWRRQEDDSVSE